MNRQGQKASALFGKGYLLPTATPISALAFLLGGEMAFHIYLIAAEQHAMKIGIAKDINKRMESLQTGNHCKLRIVAIYRTDSLKLAANMEKTVHGWLNKHHIRGEWFKHNPSMGEAKIDSFCKATTPKIEKIKGMVNRVNDHARTPIKRKYLHELPLLYEIAWHGGF